MMILVSPAAVSISASYLVLIFQMYRVTSSIPMLKSVPYSQSRISLTQAVIGLYIIMIYTRIFLADPRRSFAPNPLLLTSLNKRIQLEFLRN